jgi:hypothetical protein
MDFSLSTDREQNAACEIMAEQASLTDAQQRDVEIGGAAVDAFWAAVNADPRFSQPHENPLIRCILAALCVRDILAALGRRDAVATKCGLLVRRLTESTINELTIGAPQAEAIENHWNAHLVVRLGDVVLDPTFGQTRREWNHSPRATVCLVGLPEFHEDVPVRLGLVVRSYYNFAVGEDAAIYEVAYFKLSRAVDLQTRKWKEAPDASPERRKGLVAAAVEIYRRR